MLLRKWEMPWRPCYESYAAGVWLACGMAMAWMWMVAPVPHMPFVYLGCVSGLFFLFNAGKTWEIWRLKWSLGGKGIDFINDTELSTKVIAGQGESVWCGYGFDWTPLHTQRLYEIKRADPEEFYPPKMVMDIIESWTDTPVGANTPGYIGAPWIHGLNAGEEDLYVPVNNFIGNTLLLGTTRCGKTRWIELIVEMAIQMNHAVIIIDPKGDTALEETCRTACAVHERSGDFARFHLAFPNSSVRIDPLKNYTNPSDLASRISALMPGGDKSSSFRDFAWGVLNAIILGQLEVGEKPTLVGIRSYVDNSVADLLIRVVNQYFDAALPPGWTEDVVMYARTLKSRKGKDSEDGELMVRQSLNLLLGYYLDNLVPAGYHNEAVEALSTIYKHDGAHYSKMISNLVPILGMLTTGDLGKLLSPDPRETSDPRDMTDLQALIRRSAVVYIGLDSLANKTISSAVGAMLLSDLTSVAASIYNFAPPAGEQKKVWLIVDEASEVVNDPYVSMLNKSAGAGFINVAAAQTIPDFAARFESMDKARQMLGNFNNLFVMRVKDGVTQEFCVETFGETYVTTKQMTLATSSSTEKNITHFTGSVQERVTEALEAVFPPDILGQLPNWQYIASVGGGRLIKGRLPIIQHDNHAS
jgi:conjugal transfer pilus assembly protein TraD